MYVLACSQDCIYSLLYRSITTPFPISSPLFQRKMFNGEYSHSVLHPSTTIFDKQRKFQTNYPLIKYSDTGWWAKLNQLTLAFHCFTWQAWINFLISPECPSTCSAGGIHNILVIFPKTLTKFSNNRLQSIDRLHFQFLTTKMMPIIQY